MKIESLEQPVKKLPYAKPVLQELGDLKAMTLASGSNVSGDGSSTPG